jgi:hypothetical protein
MCNQCDSRKYNSLNVEFVDSVMADLGSMSEKISKIKELHKEVNGPYDDTACEHCTYLANIAVDPLIEEPIYIEYPCETIISLIELGYCAHGVYRGCERCWR